MISSPIEENAGLKAYLQFKFEEINKFSSSIFNSSLSIKGVSRKVSFSEILNTALPNDTEVEKLNQLINEIQTNRSIDLIGSYYVAVHNALLTLSQIVDRHWDDFALETKVLLLYKLAPLKSTWQLGIKVFFGFILNLVNPRSRGWKRIFIYRSLDANSRKKADIEILSDFESLSKSFKSFQKVANRIFKKDGELIYKNKQNINRFINNLDQSKLRILRNLYSFDDDLGLLTYLRYNPDIFSLLKDAHPYFINYFTPQNISLETSQDIDNSDLKSLSITIQVSKSSDTCLLKLNEFRDSYWFNLPWSLIKNIIIGFDC